MSEARGESEVKAYSYVRFSSPEQSKGDSLRRQLEQTESYCQEHGLTLDKTLSLRDLGLSAFRGKNVAQGKLGQFLKLVEQGRIPKGSVLIVENLDRLSRDQVGEAVHLFMSILRGGVDVVTLTDRHRFSQSSLNNPIELMVSIMTFYRSHDESAQKSYRLRKAWEQKRKRLGSAVATSRVPAWLRLNKQSGKIEEIPESANVVRRVFRLSREGMGHHTIAKQLNQEGVACLGKGKCWHGSYIAKLLSSRTVLGEYQPHTTQSGRRTPIGDPITNYYPAVISERDFNGAKAAKASRRGKLGRPTTGTKRNLFSGLVRCGYCGEKMQWVNKDGSWIAMVCANAMRGLGCSYNGFPYADLESSFLDFCTEIDISSLVHVEKTDAIVGEIQETEGAILEVNRQLENLLDAIGSGSGENAPAALLKRVGEKELEKARIEARLDELRTSLGTTESPEDRIQAVNSIRRKAADVALSEDDNLRLRLSECIRGLVQEITVFPIGRIKGTFARPLDVASHVARKRRHYFVHLKGVEGFRLVHFEPVAKKFVSGTIPVKSEDWVRLLKTRERLG
jgi:DNA invertase Pin-like site-specific DNA recombinase